MSKPKFIIIDIESCGFNPRKDAMHGLGIATSEDDQAYYPIWDIPQHVRDMLADPEIDKVAHFARFDIKFLLWNGFEFKGRWYCTQALAHTLDENSSSSLENLAIRYLNESPYSWKQQYKQVLKKAGVNNMAQLHRLDLLDPTHPWFPSIEEYNKGDLSVTYKLYVVLKKKLKDSDKLMKDVLGVKNGLVDFFLNEVMPFEKILLQMEMKGIRINKDRITSVQKEFAARKEQLEKELNERYLTQIFSIEEVLYQTVLAGKVTEESKAKIQRQNSKQKTKFNWNSTAHVGKLIFETFKVPEDLTVRTKRGDYSLSAPYLRVLMSQFPANSEVVKAISTYLDYQKVKKIAVTYTGTAKKGIVSKIETNAENNSVIYTEYSQFLNTWRSSSSKPNLQNLPRKSPVKSFFRTHADDSIILHIDASQIEFRVAAHLSQDPEMLRQFREGLDPHRSLASKVYDVEYSSMPKDDERRQAGKTCNFLLIFDGKEGRLREELSKVGLKKTIEECQEIRRGFFELFETYEGYLRKQLNFMRTYHRVICESGAVRRIPEIIYGNYVKYGSNEFTGPKEIREKLKAEIESGTAPKLVYDAGPELEKMIVKLCSLKFSHAKKQGYNFPIQHLAAHIMKAGAGQLVKAGYRILHETHDSYDIEIKIATHKTDITRILSILENCYPLSVPLEWEYKLLTSFDEGDKVVIDDGGNLMMKKKTG